VSIRLFDSKEQAVRAFIPREAGRVGMYVCGPTVQSSPHVGHLRSALVYDQLRRWLTYRGLAVTLVRNVTDIDDKVLENATANETWWALAYRMEREFNAAYDALRIQAPTYEPRATAHILDMLALIARLIQRGHAYEAADGSGDVYFDTASFAAYGALTRQTPEAVEADADADVRGKKNPADFALWKGHKAGEPESAAWVSPWGVGSGRPGWHIECSAMATRYLGSAFDIHGGGLDLRFPHHENELAQSTAAGDEFAGYWLHNGLVHVGGQKMSKSLGNSFFAADLLAQQRPIVVRYFLGSAHYRSTLELHETALAEAASAFERIEGFLARANRAGLTATASVPEAFTAAMDDDMGIPTALAVLHDTVRAGNTALDANDSVAAGNLAAAARGMLDVLGLNPESAEWADQSDSAEQSLTALDSLVSSLLESRATARANKDFATSDRIRDELAAAGITIEDTPDGAHWSFHG
jgi:cysteinyl-tRNA synthetase